AVLPSDSGRVASGNAIDVPLMVMMLRMFQLGCKKRGSTFGALSSMKTDTAQSRSSELGGAPSTLVRLATPVVVELTRLNQNVFSVPAGRWSATKRRKLQIAPRVGTSSSSGLEPIGPCAGVS